MIANSLVSVDSIHPVLSSCIRVKLTRYSEVVPRIEVMVNGSIYVLKKFNSL